MKWLVDLKIYNSSFLLHPQSLLKCQGGFVSYVFQQIEAVGDSGEKVLVFFKLYPTVITEDNLDRSLLVSSMLESPINTLYQSVKQVFAPVLLQVSFFTFTKQYNLRIA